MDRTRRYSQPLFLLICVSSCAGLSYEMALMRVFSVSLSYHFAFMVISIAMLGISASGTALSVFLALKEPARIPLYGLLFAASIPLSYLTANAVPFDPIQLAWQPARLFTIGLFYIMLCIPFFFFGLIVSSAYAALPDKANTVYSSDLIGAGSGALAVTGLLFWSGPETAMFVMSSLVAAVLFFSISDRLIRTFSAVLCAYSIIMLAVHPSSIRPGISAYKPLALALQYPGAEHLGTRYSPYSRIDIFKSPAARYAPGLSLKYLDPLPDQTGIAIDAGELHAITDDSDVNKLRFIRSLPSGLVYRLSANSRALIIEPRTGLAVLTARMFGVRDVIAIDSNPLLVRTVRDQGVSVAADMQQGFARTWLAGTDDRFDSIDLSCMGSLPSAVFGFAEDYRFTTQAFEQYLSHLSPDGLLSINLYLVPPPRTEFRLIATLARSGEAAGIRNISRHIAVVRSWDTVTLIMKRSALTGEDIRRIRKFAREMRFDLAYFPGMMPAETNLYVKQSGPAYAEAFQQLLNIDSREQFMNNYLFDIRPVSDERPFFHHYLKIGNIRETYRIMGAKWQFFLEQGYLLPALLFQVVVIGCILVLIPLIRIRKTGPAVAGGATARTLSYFALIGLAYLFVETALVQKMILCLEHPFYAASTVIASLLISSGLGSMLGRRSPAFGNARVLIALAAAVVIMSLLLPGAIPAISRFPHALRTALAVLLVMPVGLLMGIPFPLGMSVICGSSPSLVPLAWAVNGCFSVAAPILAVMLALSTGYHGVLLIGAASYLAAYGVISHRSKSGGTARTT